MFKISGKVKVTRDTPEASQQKIGRRFKGGVTLRDEKTGDCEIIIDSSLPPPIQSVYLEHELVQLQVIADGASRYGESILPSAHFAGLTAGLKKAKELGVQEEYLKHRKESE